MEKDEPKFDNSTSDDGLPTSHDTETSCKPSSSSCFSASQSKKRSLDDNCPLVSKVARVEGTSADLQLKQSYSNSLHEADCLNSTKLSINEKTVVNISHVPASLLLQTFSHLSLHDLFHGVSLVSKSWYSLTHDPSLWRRICLRKYNKVTDSVLLKLTSLSENVQYLDISDLRLVTSDGVTAALKHCRQLQTLKMLRCMHHLSSVFQSIGEHCPAILQLYLDGCYALRDDDLYKISAGCPKLELLRINQCNKVTTQGIRTIAERCPRLKQITMDQCTNVSDGAIAALVDNCPNLEAISCMSCHLTDEGVTLLAKAKELRFMEVSNIKSVRNQSIIRVVQNCPHLESINVSLCNSINDACVEFIAKNAKMLKKIYLVSCDLSDEALISLGSYSKTVETVDVGWCRAITDAGVRAISATCPTLHYLGLMRCDRVTIPVTEELVVRYPHITYSTRWLDCKRLLERAHREGARALPSLEYIPQDAIK